SGLASGEPVFLCGPPGTAKTAMVEEMARCLSVKYFYYLLTRFTEPDELLGPLDVSALRAGEYKRIMANRLPDSDIVFLDEIFKAGSAVLNVLLDVILNRRILNGTEYIPLPTLAIYTASNEVTSDADLSAFYDRLLIRSFIQYVSDDLIDTLLSYGVLIDTKAPRERPSLSRDYVIQLQNFTALRARTIAADQTLREKIVKAIIALKGRGIILSDRRKVKLVKVVAAVSTVLGEKEVTPGAVGTALLLVAPHDEEELKKVHEVVAEEKLSPFDFTAYHTLIEEGLAIAEKVRERLRNDTISRQELMELRGVREELAKLYEKIPRNLLTITALRRIYAAISEIDTVLRSISG
ncbi:MAG: AAA family ATPase, partial [Thermofilaceae archaeon]